MSEQSETRFKAALEEVRAFFRGEGEPMKFHIPDGKGGSVVRVLTLDDYIAISLDRKESVD